MDHDLRTQALIAARRHRAAWIDIARRLHEVAYGGDYKEWGHNEIDEYASAELGYEKSEVRKLMTAYDRLKAVDPESLREYEDAPAGEVPPEMPDLDTALLLDKAIKQDCPENGDAVAAKELVSGVMTREPGKTVAAVKRELRQRLRKPKPTPGDDDLKRLSVVRAARRLKQQVADTDLVPDDLRAGLVPLLDRIEELPQKAICLDGLKL